jgi:hypothetical protein
MPDTGISGVPNRKSGSEKIAVLLSDFQFGTPLKKIQFMTFESI